MPAHTMTITTALDSLSLAMRPRTKFEPEKTFWSELCRGCQSGSREDSFVRPFGPDQAWDIAGPVLWHWKDILKPRVKEYFDHNRSSILKKDDWLASIDCWMVGPRLPDAKPTIIIVCSRRAVAHRLKRLMRDDRYVQGSGFAFVGRRGNLRLATGSEAHREQGRDRSGERVLRGPDEQGTPTERQRAISPSSYNWLATGLPRDSGPRPYPPVRGGSGAFHSIERHFIGDSYSSSGDPRTTLEPSYTDSLLPRESPYEFNDYREADAAGRRGPVSSGRSSPPTSTSTNLSAVASRFTEIDLGEYRKCENFYQEHPEILHERPRAFLDTAVDWLRVGRVADARRCIQQYLILRGCEELEPHKFFDGLNEKDERNVRAFIADFDRVLAIAIDRAQPPKPLTDEARTGAALLARGHSSLQSLYAPSRLQREGLESTFSASQQTAAMGNVSQAVKASQYAPRYEPKERYGSFTSRASEAETQRLGHKLAETWQQRVVPGKPAETKSRNVHGPIRSSPTTTEVADPKSVLNVRKTGGLKPKAERQVPDVISQKQRKQRSKGDESSRLHATENNPSTTISGPTSYLGNTIHVTSGNFPKEERSATLGGQILVKDQLWDLTVGHIFLRNGVSIGGQSAQDQSWSVESTSDIFSLDSDAEDEEEENHTRRLGDAGAVEQTPRDDFVTSAQVKSSHDSFVRADKMRVIPPASMEGDWALLCSRNFPRRQSDNGIELYTSPVPKLTVSKADRLERTQPVCVLGKGMASFRGWHCYASASPSLINLPGSSTLQEAHSLSMTCRKSLNHVRLYHLADESKCSSWRQRCLGD